MKQVFAEHGGGRRVVVRRAAISVGGAACYGALLLVALSGVPDLPTAQGPLSIPAPQTTPQSPETPPPPPSATPPTTPPPTTTPGEPRTVSPPESRGAPEPVRETSSTGAKPAPDRATSWPDRPDTRASDGSPQPGGDRGNGRGHDDPPRKARTTPPKSGR
ncbi:hypothetical protein [Amycolatopsis sp. NPDC102389]|uniref:hypothetical protein n=1 Tax=Amycolatopsis sp. NPDC102389 TaxID=3363941 RepID=UPI00381BFF68